MSFMPETLGRNAASVLYKKITAGVDSVEEYKSFDLKINNTNVIKFGFKVPEDLFAYLSL